MPTPTLIQQVDAVGAAAGGTLTATLAAITAGSTIIIEYGSASVGNGIVNSINVIGGVTPTQHAVSNAVRNLEVWKAFNVTGGGTSVVVNASTANQSVNYIRVQEWANVTSIPTTAGKKTTANGNSTTPAIGALTPAASAPAVACACVRAGGAYSAGPTNGFAASGNNLWDTGAAAPRDLESHLAIPSPDGVTTYSTSYTVSSGTWEAIGFLLVGTGSPSASITTQPPAKVRSGVAMTAPKVTMTTDGTTTDTGYTSNVVASLASGSGVLSGTTTVAAVAGVATFSNLIITGAGNHVLRFTPVSFSALTAATTSLVGTTGVFVERSVLVAEPSLNTTDTVTLAGGNGHTSVSQSVDLPAIRDVSGNIAAGDAWMVIGGVSYPLTFYDGSTSVHTTGGGTVTAQPFSYIIRRRFWVFIPGTLSGSVAPYPTMIYWHGSGGKGYDDTAHMDGALAEIPEKVGFPQAGVPNVDTTSPWFGTDNWPCLTIFPQSANGTSGTNELVALIAAIRADVAAAYSLDPLRLYGAGTSYGCYVMEAYVAEHASEFAALLIQASATNDFYFRKFAPSYTGGASVANARAFASSRMAAAGVWVRHWVGSADVTWSAFGDGASNFVNDQTSFTNAYTAAGLTTGNITTSKYYSQVDEVSFGGTPWDHVATYTNVTKQQSLWTNMFAIARTAVASSSTDGGTGGATLQLMRRIRARRLKR